MTPTATNTCAAPAPASANGSAPPSETGELELVLHYPDLTGPSSTPDTRRRFVATLRKAMVGLGFFYLRDSPLEAERASLFDLTERFFALPVEVRARIDQRESRHFRGYSGIGTEYTQSKQDNREQIDLGMEAPALPQSLVKPEYLGLWGPNQFPDVAVSDLRGAVLRYMDVAEEVTIALTRGIEEAIGVPAGRLQQELGLEEKQSAFDAVRALSAKYEAVGRSLTEEEVSAALPRAMPYERMKLVRYGKEGNEQGVGAHRDGGWITLLATDEKPGLQVEDLDGTWLDVPYRPGCVLVNFGQQLERVSSGLINAATHRVRIYPSPSPRISTPYFSMPSLRAIIQPISADQMSPEVIADWQAAVFARSQGAGKGDELSAGSAGKKGIGRVSSVPEGDLHGAEQEEFGHVAWRGLTRSHPETFERWYGAQGQTT